MVPDFDKDDFPQDPQEIKLHPQSAASDVFEKVLGFPRRFISYDKPLRMVLGQFVLALRHELNLVSVDLYRLYPYTRTLGRTVCSDPTLPLCDLHRLEEIISFSKRVEVSNGDGTRTFYLPLLRDGSKLEDPLSDEAAKWGVLVVVVPAGSIPDIALVLMVAGMQMVHAAETYELVRYRETVAGSLRQAHLLSTFTAGDVSDIFEAVQDLPIVRDLFDGLALRIYCDGEWLCSGGSYSTENLEALDIASVCPPLPWQEPVESRTALIGEFHSVLLCPLQTGSSFQGALGFFTSRPFRPEERAAAMVISQQVSTALEISSLRNKLELQNLALKYEKDFSDKIFASINSGIIVIDTQGIIITANPYALQDLEFSVEEMVGSPLDEIIPGIINAALNNEREGVFTIRGGKTVCLGFNISPLKSTDGFSGTIILFRDITEIMSLRKELRRKEYFSTIGRMASWVAHEVRNPVFAISSIANILQKQNPDPDQERFLASILKETRTLNLLVDDLLRFGKPMQLNTERIVVGDFLAEISDGMKSIAREMGGEIEIPGCAAGITAEFDRERMKQVFYNLVKNALEAGADLVTIDVGRDEGNVLMTIRDNGKGIKESELPEMFTPFFTTKRTGTGLGLSICQKIVDEHGGSIHIVSRPEMGAEVTIHLPAR